MVITPRDQFPEVIILGAGVVGLTTAALLVQKGWRSVHVLADQRGAARTSANAGAIWEPLLDDTPERRWWSDLAFKRFQELFADPASGVRMMPGTKASRSPQKERAWPFLPDFTGWTATPDRRTGPAFASEWRCQAPLIDMPSHLGFLEDQLVEAGVTFETRTVRDLRELDGAAPVVVNCTGHRAAALTGDRTVRPAKGQLVVVENPGITEFFCEHVDGPQGDSAYLFPQGERLILGGSFTLGDDSTEPSDEVRDMIVNRCAAVGPAMAELRDAKVLEQRVGHRPERPSIRLEAESLGSTHLIHNYGHGSAGVTLAHGSAERVHELILEWMA